MARELIDTGTDKRFQGSRTGSPPLIPHCPSLRT